jgi:hypothetical protein
MLAINPVGIDAGKFHLDVHWLAGRRHTRVANDPAGHADLLRLLGRARPDRVVVESTGGYETPLVHTLSRALILSRLRAGITAARGSQAAQAEAQQAVRAHDAETRRLAAESEMEVVAAEVRGVEVAARVAQTSVSTTGDALTPPAPQAVRSHATVRSATCEAFHRSLARNPCRRPGACCGARRSTSWGDGGRRRSPRRPFRQFGRRVNDDRAVLYMSAVGHAGHLGLIVAEF